MNKRLKQLQLAMIPFVLPLTACGPTKVESLPVPLELRHCKSEPLAPVYPAQDWSSIDAAKVVQRQRDELTLAWVLALRSWGGDCEAKVRGLDARERELGH